MLHSVPLRYDFMTKLHNMLPEALEIGEDCVLRQLVVLLDEAKETLARDFDKVFPPFRSLPPYNGEDWRDVGIHSDMLVAFAELRGIELYVFHGNRKIHHIEGNSEKYLTCFCWDNHCYFAKNSMYYKQVRCLGLDCRVSAEKVRMERDTTIRKIEAKPYLGKVEAGIFLNSNIESIRLEWLNEGIVPRANVSGFNQFNSITRATEDGDCIVKAEPRYYEDIVMFMEKVGLSYQLEGIGVATLKVIEHFISPKRETVTEQTKAQLLIKQSYQCAKCGTCLLSAAPEIDHEPRIHESAAQRLSYLCHRCHQENPRRNVQLGTASVYRVAFLPTR